jgi:pyruvate,water dikinase
LNISGEESLLIAVKRCMASLFTNRAICYREEKGFDHFKVGLSVGVQLMVRSDHGSAGVMFTLDTESGFRDAILVTGAYGLGENVVQGSVSPDEWLVFKPTTAVIARKLGLKEQTLVYSEHMSASGSPVTNLKTPVAKQQQFCLSDSEVIQLSRWGMIIEKNYGCAMDIEWAKDGNDDLFIVQARPETVFSQKKTNVLTKYRLKEKPADSRVLVTGSAVGGSIGTGVARVLHSIADMESFQPGEVKKFSFSILFNFKTSKPKGSRD